MDNQDQGLQILNRDPVGTLNLTVTNNASSNFLSKGIRYFAGERAMPLGDTTGRIRLTKRPRSYGTAGGRRWSRRIFSAML